MTLLLMAAGKGSRYGKLKQFDGLGPREEFLMEFSIFDALDAGFEHIVIITQKNNVDYLKEYLGERLPGDVELDVVPQEVEDLPQGHFVDVERAKPWGTAHAVWSARHLITEPFAVINADDYYGQKAYANAADFIADEDNFDKFGLIAYTLEDTLSEFGSVSRGVCQQNGTSLISVEERIKIERSNGTIIDTDSGVTFTGKELVSMNFWVCSPDIFTQIEEDLISFLEEGNNLDKGEVYLPFVIQGMLQQEMTSVDVIPSDSKWFGITYADDKEKAVSELKNMTDSGHYPSPLWED